MFKILAYSSRIFFANRSPLGRWYRGADGVSPSILDTLNKTAARSLKINMKKERSAGYFSKTGHHRNRRSWKHWSQAQAVFPHYMYCEIFGHVFSRGTEDAASHQRSCPFDNIHVSPKRVEYSLNSKLCFLVPKLCLANALVPATLLPSHE